MTLADRVADAEYRTQYQDNPALYDSMDDAEIDAKVKAYRENRARRLAEEIRNEQAEIAAAEKAGERSRRIAAEEADAEDERRAEASTQARWRRRAAATSERLTSTDARLAELAKLLVVGRKILLWLLPVGMLWSGINVQHNLVPDGNMANPLYWVSFGVEALISGALVFLMLTSAALARSGMTPAADASWWQRYSRYLAESGLVLVSVLLNTATPFLAGHTLLALEYAVPGLAVGLLVWVYNHMTDRLSAAIVALSAPAPTIVLDEAGLVVLGHAQRGFALMTEGVLQPSTAQDGGGVPAGGQLARHLSLSKPIANQVRDMMKTIARGDVKIVVPAVDQEQRPTMAVVSSAAQ
jgi:hypothetical protein